MRTHVEEKEEKEKKKMKRNEQKALKTFNASYRNLPYKDTHSCGQRYNVMYYSSVYKVGKFNTT